MTAATEGRADGGRHGDVVLIGARSLLGGEVRRLLSVRGFPLRDLAIMGAEKEVGQVVDFGGEACLVTALDPEQVKRADVLLLAERGPVARQALAALREGRGIAVDLVASEGPGRDPVINMEINATRLPTARPARVRSPHAVVQVLSTTMAAIVAESRLASLSVTVLTPASESGAPGVDELYQQTAAVLNFSEQPEKVFERQMAFNAVPHALMHAQQGWPDLDERLRGELQEVLSLPGEDLSLRAILVPVFHGTCLVVSARFDPPVPRAARRRRFGEPPFVAGPVTPAAIKESEGIHVFDLGDEPGGRVGLWIVADNVRCTGAVNGVRIAEAVLSGRGKVGA